MKTTTNYIDDDQKHKTQLVQDTYTYGTHNNMQKNQVFIIYHNDKRKKLHNKLSYC